MKKDSECRSRSKPEIPYARRAKYNFQAENLRTELTLLNTFVPLKQPLTYPTKNLCFDPQEH